MTESKGQFIRIDTKTQTLHFFDEGALVKTYVISTAKNGLGEKEGSECTPRGWHQIYSKIGQDAPMNAVFVARVWTGEVYSEALARAHPDRDWILTRIIQLDGLEPMRNKGGDVDSLSRFIYIHGTPDTTPLGKVGSRGCIRMRNDDLCELFEKINIGAKVFISE